MPSTLSATAAAFVFPSRSSPRIGELPVAVVCRTNEDIGTYKDGLLRPRKGTSSLIAWNEHTPFAKHAHSTAVTPVVAPGPDEASTARPATSLGSFSMTEATQTKIPGRTTLEFHQVEESALRMVQPNPASENHYHTSPAEFHDLQEQSRVHHQSGYPTTAMFYPPMYQPNVALPCDVVVSEINRPGWHPAYHKAISPSIERANQVVEEFKLYFGDGKSPELLLMNLQKICVICDLAEATDLPNTAEECINLLKEVYVNVFDLVEAGRAAEHGGGQETQVRTFKSSKQFFDYCKQEGKVCPRWIGKANPLFQDVMTRFRG